MIYPPIQCCTCRHFVGKKDRDSLNCKAFADGIPLEIVLNEHDHREPFPGDNGIRWEPIDSESEASK